MKMKIHVLSLAVCAFAAPTSEKRQLFPAPSVQLSYANVVGSSSMGVDTFKGIPFAQPPLGPLRLRPPQPIVGNLGTIQATSTPNACPQFNQQIDSTSLPDATIAAIKNSPYGQQAQQQSEDCLTINVQRPSTATAASNLPVLFWIYGGGFEFGSTQSFDGSNLIRKSVLMGQDIVYVAVNYRVAGFGFLAGKEVLADGAANLGLLDQRAGLKWVADNIAKFGGDPAKVTMWGESAGAISVNDQMIAYNGNTKYNGKPLFRGAIMNSGCITPADPVDCPKAQAVYDSVVAAAGCKGFADTLNCLRAIPYPQLKAAMDSQPAILGYQSVALAYLPRPDGVFLTKSPETLIQTGRYPKIPLIIGDQEDEGTLFSLSQRNISTTAQLVEYLKTYFWHGATLAQVEGLVNTYPDVQSAGSPFRTGPLNAIYPQYKRIAALLGDVVFFLSRRYYLSILSSTQQTWSYLATYDYGTPVAGTFHSSDIQISYGTIPGFASNSVMTYYISFVNNLDPNVAATGLTNWPTYSFAGARTMLNFELLANTYTSDIERTASYDFISANLASLHV